MSYGREMSCVPGGIVRRAPSLERGLCRQQAVLTSMSAAAILLGACADPLAAGSYVLEGEAEFQTTSSVPLETISMRLALFVPDEGSGDPYYLSWRGAIVPLTFTGGGNLSDDVCTLEGCNVRVERDTGCAVVEYANYIDPPISGTGNCRDYYWYNTGTLPACPTEEKFEPSVVMSGSLEPHTILLDGLVGVRTNYPWDPDLDAIEITVDGTTIDAPAVSAGSDRFGIELGTVAVGSDVRITYTGSRALELTPPTAFSTTSVITHLSLDTAPPEGSIDARGQSLRFESGSLVIDDEGSCPRAPFAIAVALGDPGGATMLRLLAMHASRAGGYTQASVARGDVRGEVVTLLAGDATGPLAEHEVPVPAGDGPAWLLLTNLQDVPVPSDIADPRVLTMDALEWL